MVISKQLFFPFFGLLKLRRQRGERWMELVDWVSALPRSDPHAIAFTLTMRRLNRQTGSRCSDPWCATCAAQAVERFEGSEQELLALYWQNVDEVKYTLKSMQSHSRARQRQARVA